MARALGRSLFAAVLLACAWPTQASPLLSLILSIAQQVASQPDPAPAMPVVELPPTYPGTTVEPATLRRLIDDSFLYLSAEQRDQVFEALNAELLKPANAALRGPIIEHFTERALQVRAAQLRLGELTFREKQMLADELRREAQSLPEAELEQLRQTLEKGLLPVPSDLNQLLLAALD